MFTQEQLDGIKFAARRTKNQGELAVFSKLLEDSYIMPTLSRTQIDVIKFCAEECKRQHSGEMSVYDMVNAWNWTSWFDSGVPLTLDIIETIGTMVEPFDNKNGFRTIPIGVTDGLGGWIEKAPYWEVPDKLEDLLIAYYEGRLTPALCDCGSAVSQHMSGCSSLSNWQLNQKTVRAEDEFYFQYEEIHPFRDGNGRSGKILYNYLCGTLDNPIMPPNFWGGSNP